MEKTQSKAVNNWLIIMLILVTIITMFGAYTRLTRSGLSIVEWNVIMGTFPPLGETAWQAEFEKYQATPEFRLINFNMTLDGYKQIFYIEYFHRLIARIIGLAYVLPLFYFLLRGIIPWRRSVPYLAIGLLFAFQGFMGWYMVASGLDDRPSVSHYRLTAHLMTALLIFGATFWIWLSRVKKPVFSEPVGDEKLMSWLSWILLIVLVVQIIYGGFMAGLKAGFISNTFPLMFGKLIPWNVMNSVEPWFRNLVDTPATVHFIHRWFAFVVLIAALWIYWIARKSNAPKALHTSTLWMIGLISIQVLLGIFVVWFSVPISLAVIHQGTAVGLLAGALLIVYQTRAIRKFAV